MFPIVSVSSDSSTILEQMGTKSKFWYDSPGGTRFLFKEGRANTGENWAEKLACELAGLLDMPHANYDLAEHEGRPGVVCQTIVPKNTALIHGNELLTEMLPNYRVGEQTKYQRCNHTVARVSDLLSLTSFPIRPPIGFQQVDGIQSGLDVFIGYLMFDAWIANQDRHDENWGCVHTADNEKCLAPSYDHGASFGRNETDQKRLMMLETKDQNQNVEAYILKARSALYADCTDDTDRAGRLSKPRPLLTIEAFSAVGKRSPAAMSAWLNRLKRVSEADVRNVVERFPTDVFTDVAKTFTLRLLELNKARLLNLMG